jgi:hypothetical protein
MGGQLSLERVGDRVDTWLGSKCYTRDFGRDGIGRERKVGHRLGDFKSRSRSLCVAHAKESEGSAVLVWALVECKLGGVADAVDGTGLDDEVAAFHLDLEERAVSDGCLGVEEEAVAVISFASWRLPIEPRLVFRTLHWRVNLLVQWGKTPNNLRVREILVADFHDRLQERPRKGATAPFLDSELVGGASGQEDVGRSAVVLEESGYGGRPSSSSLEDVLVYVTWKWVGDTNGSGTSTDTATTSASFLLNATGQGTRVAAVKNDELVRSDLVLFRNIED